MTKASEVEIVKPTVPAVVPKLKSGDDAETAAHLTQLFDDAHNGMRKIIALGLFAWEIKETQLKHGQFGAWLAANCPKLATIDSVTGNPKTSRALCGYMDLTKSVLENTGFKTVGKYLATVAKFANDANLGHGKFLLIEEKKVPAELKETREKICSLVDGKTQRALFTEFKQADEEEDGLKVKRGQNKGSKGLTKEMRERAKQREEEQRIFELNEEAKDTRKWLLENADAKNLGLINFKTLLSLRDAAETLVTFVNRLEESRKQN